MPTNLIWYHRLIDSPSFVGCSCQLRREIITIDPAPPTRARAKIAQLKAVQHITKLVDIAVTSCLQADMDGTRTITGQLLSRLANE